MSRQLGLALENTSFETNSSIVVLSCGLMMNTGETSSVLSTKR